ncbi:MAG: type IV secretory system conjugative DNA transfer family protein [Thiothrix sp.]|nr:type IV secretory system conjugative DNA transfer family protein [Thiothrix sp.]
MKKPAIGVATGKAARTPARILLNLLILSLLLLIVSAVSTQYMAWRLGFHPALGAIGEVAGYRLYLPWSWIVWAIQYGTPVRPVLASTFGIFLTGATLALLLFAVGRLMARRSGRGIENLHGSAHWADRNEIVTAGLLPRKPGQDHQGVYVGGWRNPKTGKTEYLRHNGPEHVLAFAPTRSGKGVGLVLPTLLSWPHSCMVFDIKGENHALTSGWRKEHAKNRILKFDPTADDGSCARYNPLAEIRINTADEIRDVQNIAALLVDPNGKGMEDHWSRTAYDLMSTLILHCCYVRQSEGGTANLSDIEAVLTRVDPDQGADVEGIFKAMAKHPHKNGQPHALVKAGAVKMMQTPEKERGSIISTALSFLSLYKDPIVRDNVSESHWAIEDLMGHDGQPEPVSLYLVVKPSDADRLRPLIRLMISQIVNRLTESMQFRDGASVAGYKNRMLVLLDEFASLQNMAVIERALAYAAGYGIKFYLIVQDLQQIVRLYTREEGLIGNCHIRIAYAPNKIETAELLSKMSGITTIQKEAITTSGKRHALMLESTSITYQEVQRPLITADEAMRLPGAQKDNAGNVTRPGDMLIFPAGSAGIYGVQILYFLDPVFMARAKIPTVVESDRIRGTENLAQVRTDPDDEAAPVPEKSPTAARPTQPAPAAPPATEEMPL